jgi:hypothetical protein
LPFYQIFARFMAFDVQSIRGRRRLDEVEESVGITSQNGLSLEQKMSLVKNRHSLVLWRSPLRTVYYLFLESGILLRYYGAK